MADVQTVDEAAGTLPVMELSIDEEWATERIARRLTVFERWFAGISKPLKLVGSELFYKPYYFTTCRQRKRFGVNSFHEKRIEISVDGLTGIASVYSELPNWDYVPRDELESRANVVEPMVTSERAEERTTRKMTHVEVRTKSIVELEGEPMVLYKPIWFITLESKRPRRFAVDGVTGNVLQD